MKTIARRAGYFLLWLTLAAVFLCGQADSGRAEVLAAENSWNKAELNHDAAALEKLMADDLVMTETDGSVINKKDEVAFTADPEARFEIQESHDLKVQLHGDTAVVTGTYHEKGTYHGKGFEHRGRFTDTWIRQSGTWQCVASHFSMPVQD